MPGPSYYFTLFKKLQVLGHVPDATSHGTAAGLGGFTLATANDVFAGSNRGALLGATAAASPLWAVLNSRAMGNAGFTPVAVGGVNWPTMPVGSPPGWSDFQTAAPPPKLVATFADWINGGKINDIPTAVLAGIPPAIAAGERDPGVVPFVCSMPSDNGVRPGAVPGDFWATSLIFLVDPMTGGTVNPGALAATNEYFLVGVVGNRGNTGGGRFAATPGEAIEAAGWVMVWNSGTSPAVQLPALSNLDATSILGTYEQLFLDAGAYDVVGFRLDVQTVFDGLVAAIAASGVDLGGLTPEQWVHADGAHLCAKVLIRNHSESWPTLGSTPVMDRRIAQKNLAPFAVDLAVVDPDPAIHWRNFMVGDVIEFLHSMIPFDRELGTHRLHLRADVAKGIRVLLAVPPRSFARWFDVARLKGAERLAPGEAQKCNPPFKEAIVLALTGADAEIKLPALGREFLAMALGIQYRPTRTQAGPARSNWTPPYDGNAEA